LADWPTFGKMNQEIISETEMVREVVEQALALRAKSGIKVRQPLASISLGKDEYILFKNVDYAQILLDEINVKKIIFVEVVQPVDTLENSGLSLDTNLTEELVAEGRVRELTRAIQDLRKKSALSTGDKIRLKIFTENSDFAKSMHKFSVEISKTVNAADFQIVESGAMESMGDSHTNILGSQSVNIDGVEIRVEIFKQ
jgi:isoleucyl-tRNA synthetase